jgi:hypothetical protein
MSSLLDGCWAKIERANENIQNLNSEISAFVHPDNYIIVRNVDHQTKTYTFSAFGQAIPLRFSVLVGEIIHHLQSSLDHLIWALVAARHQAPNFKVQFPICLTAEKFKSAVKGGIIKGIAGSAQDIIERVQPYQNTDWRNVASDDPLAILHEFNNTDKHKLLAVVVSAAHIPMKLNFLNTTREETDISKIIPAEWSGRLLRAEPNGTEVLRIEFTKMNPKLHVDADFSYQIAFEEFGTREIEPVVPSLMHLRNATVKTIKLFAHEFE